MSFFKSLAKPLFGATVLMLNPFCTVNAVLSGDLQSDQFRPTKDMTPGASHIPISQQELQGCFLPTLQSAACLQVLGQHERCRAGDVWRGHRRSRECDIKASQSGRQH